MAEPGDSAEIVKTFSQADFDRFAALSGDDNPIHVDPTFSATTRFGRTVSHGVLLLTVLRGVLGQLVPGARQRSQRVMFPAPTFTGEAMRFVATVTAVDGDAVTASVRSVRVADGTVTCDGTVVLQREEA